MFCPVHGCYQCGWPASELRSPNHNDNSMGETVQKWTAKAASVATHKHIILNFYLQHSFASNDATRDSPTWALWIHHRKKSTWCGVCTCASHDRSRMRGLSLYSLKVQQSCGRSRDGSCHTRKDLVCQMSQTFGWTHVSSFMKEILSHWTLCTRKLMKMILAKISHTLKWYLRKATPQIWTTLHFWGCFGKGAASKNQSKSSL